LVDIASPYRSPIRLIRYAGESFDTWSQKAVTQARKKLLAEAALSGDDLVIDDIHVSKNDITTQLGDLSEASWNHHGIIYTNDALLQFLEEFYFDSEGFAQLGHLWEDEAFADFIAPYFALAFNEAYGRLLKNDESELLAELMRYHHLVRAEYSGIAFEKIRIYLSELTHRLRNLSWERFREDESVLYFIFSSAWMRFINALPQGFAATRDELGSEILSVVYRFQHKATWAYLYEVCEKLGKLDCSDEIKEQVREYAKVMSANSLQESEAKSGGSGSNPWRIGFGAVWLVVILIRLFTNGCGGSRNDYNINFNSLDAMKGYGSLADMRNAVLAGKANEESLRSTFIALSNGPNKGKAVALKTGDNPFRILGEEMPARGDSKLVIRNTTKKDAVLFTCDDLRAPNDRIQAVFIKAGEDHELRIDPSYVPKLFLAFGNQWIRAKILDSVMLKTFKGNSVSSVGNDLQSDIAGVLYISEYFKSPMSTQPFLRQGILVRGSDAGGSLSTDYTTLHQPPSTLTHPNRKQLAILIFREEGKTVRMNAEGDLGVYLEKKVLGAPAEKVEIGNKE
jgi:hypothetical protein